MKAKLHKAKRSTRHFIYIRQKYGIDIDYNQKGELLIKVPFKATTQNRLILDLHDVYIDYWISTGDKR